MILAFSLTSCFSTKRLVSETEIQTADFNSHMLNGKYKNQINDSQHFGLWHVFAENNRFRMDTTVVTKTSIIDLKLVDPKTLKIDLIDNDSIIKSMTLKGKIKGDFFSIKKKFLLIPIPALMLYKERKTIIANDVDGNLVLTKGSKNGAWILVMAADIGGITNYKFERVND